MLLQTMRGAGNRDGLVGNVYQNGHLTCFGVCFEYAMT